MAEFSSQQQHGLTADIFSAAHGADSTVLETAQRIAAAEEITLKYRNIITAVERRNCSCFGTEHQDKGFIKEAGEIAC